MIVQHILNVLILYLFLKKKVGNKGYSDGRASIVEELEKIKDEIQDYEIMSVNGNSPENVFYIARDLFIRVIDNHIKELKGEK